jgi:hypothetical protein
MSPFVEKIVSRCLSFIRSDGFFWVIVGVLIFQAAWLALTARFPMAFDENFHFGIIQLFAHQWGPFFSSAPPNSGQYGDLVRNPSYLYQYLMSFPYRLIAHFIHQESIQIILLRFINIGLFALGLAAFRRFLRHLNVSSGIVNISLLMLVLVPVVPFLAGQINYDNLIFLIIPVVGLLTLSCRQKLQASGAFPPKELILLASLCLLGSLVKYAFLPIVLALFIYLVVALLRSSHRTTALTAAYRAFWSLSRWLKLGLIVLFLIALGLFTERYGENIVRYHSLQPNCSKIESVEQCLQYGPWARNYVIAANNEAAQSPVPLDPNLSLFAPTWIRGMMHRLYFAINYDYYNYAELPVNTTVAYIIGGLGLLLSGLFWRQLRKKQPFIMLPVVIITLYVASLLYVNFTDYLHFKTMLAINGRYLILILPLVFAIFASAYSVFLQNTAPKNATTYKLGLTAIVTILSLQGAGIVTYIVRSDDNWYWPNSVITEVNLAAKKILIPLTIGADHKERSKE